MKKLGITVLLTIALGAPFAHADEATKFTQAEKLLTLLKVDQQLEVTNLRMRESTRRMVESQNLPEELAAKMQTVFDKQFDMVSAATKWDSMKNEIIAIYTQTFTEEEINGLVTFYQSDLGQKMLNKLPELFQKGMEIAQGKLMAQQQDIQKKMMEEWVNFESALTDEERAILESIQQPGNGIQN